MGRRWGLVAVPRASCVSRGVSWGRSGVCWEPLRTSWALLGASWALLATLFRRSGERAGRSGAHLRGNLSEKGGGLKLAWPPGVPRIAFWAPLEAILKRSGGPLGPLLGFLWAFVGNLRAILRLRTNIGSETARNQEALFFLGIGIILGSAGDPWLALLPLDAVLDRS